MYLLLHPYVCIPLLVKQFFKVYTITLRTIITRIIVSHALNPSLNYKYYSRIYFIIIILKNCNIKTEDYM